MIHAYLTFASKTARFAKKVSENAINVSSFIPLSEDTVIYIPTYMGMPIDDDYRRYVAENKEYIKGIVAIGNINFGASQFCRTGIELGDQFNIPVLAKLDYANLRTAVESVRKKVYELETYSVKQPSYAEERWEVSV